MSADGAVLEFDGVTMSFGGLVAVRELTMSVSAGEIFGLIGPNGAGKTTVINGITGYYQVDSGDIRFEQHSIRRLPRHQITRLGIARTFQNLRLFEQLTVVENVMVATDAHHRTGFTNALFGLPRHRREERNGRESADDLLRLVHLDHRGGEFARNLSYGDQRRLEIARALATRPRLLLLDEPGAGFEPSEKLELVELIRTIRERGTTVFLIEHDMGMVMKLCERIVVLDFGLKIAEGTAEQIQNDHKVIEAYLGTETEIEDASRDR
ncbi:MAG: ABC transporter ATP-binding protein [Sciscionella sp.]